MKRKLEFYFQYYKGEWENGKRHGYGEYTWKTFYNTTLTFPVQNTYKGTWTNGDMHGVGKMDPNFDNFYKFMS